MNKQSLRSGHLKLKVGFIGLGLMGNPMAKNILKAGFPLAVFNRNPKRLKEFRDLGVGVYDSPALLAENVDVVISCVTGPNDVKEVYLGKDGVIGSPSIRPTRSALITIDMSTIGPTAARVVGEGLIKAGVEFLDAPVTGGTIGAEKGTLTIFVGGDEAIFEKVRPVLAAMGTNLQYMGKLGNGQAIKLINNLIIGISTTALAEGFLAADAMGLSRKDVVRALENVSAMSPGLKSKMPNMVANKFPVSFSVANIRKDLKLALDESHRSKQKNKKLPTLAVAERLYKKGMDMGLSESDMSAIIEILSKS